MNHRYFLTICGCLFLATASFSQSNNATAENPAGPISELTFYESEFEFGTIQQGEMVKNVFEFENTGSEPLVIYNAKGSCGCTVPEWPKDPIMPGESAQILVQFDSKGKKGKQSKRVTLTANTKPEITYITIKGTVAIPEGQAATKVDAKHKSQNAMVEATGNARVDVDKFSVYPNPTSDQLMVSLKDYFGKTARIDIYNKLGQLMKTEKIDAVSAQALSFDVSDYPMGTYTVSVKIDGMMRVAKRVAVVK